MSKERDYECYLEDASDLVLWLSGTEAGSPNENGVRMTRKIVKAKEGKSSTT